MVVIFLQARGSRRRRWGGTGWAGRVLSRIATAAVGIAHVRSVAAAMSAEFDVGCGPVPGPGLGGRAAGAGNVMVAVALMSAAGTSRERLQ